MKLTHEVLHLPLRDPLRIARADHGMGDTITTVVVELSDDRFPGVVGLGEGYPDRFYGETPETMAAVFPLLLEALGEVEASEVGLVAADHAMERAIRGHGGARCALDIALHDLIGKVVGQPVHELRGLSADLPPTDFTVGIDERRCAGRDLPRAIGGCEREFETVGDAGQAILDRDTRHGVTPVQVCNKSASSAA